MKNDLKLIEPPKGYEIRVGDLIEHKAGSLLMRRYRVTRVTKTLAICQLNKTAAVRFDRIYNPDRFYAKPFDTWSQSRYRLLVRPDAVATEISPPAK